MTVFLHVLQGGVHDTHDIFDVFYINGEGHEDTHVLVSALK